MGGIGVAKFGIFERFHDANFATLADTSAQSSIICEIYP